MALVRRNKYKIGDTQREPRTFETGTFITIAIVENNREEKECLFIGSQCLDQKEEKQLIENIYNIVRYLNHQANMFDQIELEDSFSKFKF